MTAKKRSRWKTCEANPDGYHRPHKDGEPYNHLGASWQNPTCKCGKTLSRRLITQHGTGAKPAKGRGK